VAARKSFVSECLNIHVAQWWVSTSFCRAWWPSVVAACIYVSHGLHRVNWQSFEAVAHKLMVIFVSEQAGGKAGKDSGKAKAKAVSRSARAGLQVSRWCWNGRTYVGEIDGWTLDASRCCVRPTLMLMFLLFVGALQVRVSWLARKTRPARSTRIGNTLFDDTPFARVSRTYAPRRVVSCSRAHRIDYRQTRARYSWFFELVACRPRAYSNARVRPARPLFNCLSPESFRR